MSGNPEPSRLRLVMQSGDVWPQGMRWLLGEGYVRTVSWDDSGEMITLGLWPRLSGSPPPSRHSPP